MKKRIYWMAALMLAATTIMAQTTKKTFTLNDLLGGGSTYWNLQPKYMFSTWWGEVPVELSVEKAVRIDANGQRQGTLFTTDDLNEVLGEKVVRTCANVQFPYPPAPIVKVQTSREIILIDFERKAVEWRGQIQEGASELVWNPVSRNMAYCIGSNVFVQTADGERRQLTTDGTDDIVYGHSVSRDEFGISNGLFWSPDGKRLAFYKKDQSRIPSYPQVDITQRIAATYVDKYPMAGCETEDVSVAVYDVSTAKTVWLQNPKPMTDYMTNLSWAPDGRKLYVFELNRDQDFMQLYGYDASTGQKDAEPLVEEKHPKYVEPLNTLSFLPWDDTKAVMQTRRDNWNHLYLIDLKKKMYPEWREANGGGTTCDHVKVTLLTAGDFEVRDFLGFNEKDKSALFVGNVTHPLRATIHSVKVNTRKQILLSADDGVHSAALSKSGAQFIDTYSSPTVARKVNLVQANSGKSINLLTADDPWKDYDVPEITSGSIKAADGQTDLYYRLIKPTGFDPSKKYPTVVYVYGGPHAHNVQASRGYYFRGWEIYMAQLGYVIFVLDNRGSQYRGLKFEQATFRHLGDEEMKDQLCGVEFLKTLPYVDADRLGVHGWSFGGFMTTNLMCSYPDVFKVGVAGGPVIDWKYYEVMYGERYMDRPEQNPDGYASSSLLPKAKNLKGRLQIILGYNDPTCVPQHTLSFVRACIDAGTQPDLFTYPGDGHNMFGTDQVHLHERITRYFEDYLK
ncbi:MAG: DPP IV N-terminal domain-containing protein [Bacteroidaceae bacterium]|nr:DPP IV N-terminal domain-containing protein [Bacteroidaceae bacterium]